MRVIKMFIVMAGLLLLAVLPSMAAEKGKAEPYTVVTTEELKLDYSKIVQAILADWEEAGLPVTK